MPVTDPFAVPAVIDEAYVNRVLAALDAVDGDAFRRVVADGSVGPGATASLRSVYNDPVFEVELELLLEDVAAGLDRFKNPPGDRRTVVKQLVTTMPSCVFAEASTDVSAVVRTALAPQDSKLTVVALEPTQVGADPGNLNPTPWSISYTDVRDAGAEPKDQPCAS